MAQDAGQQSEPLDVDPELAQDQEGEGDGPSKRSGVWPWILLAIVVLIVILLLWLYWRQPNQGTVTVIKKTSEIPIVTTEPRPEPIVPGAPTETIEVSGTAHVPDVLGKPRSVAAQTLLRAGYGVSESQVFRDSKASGYVVEQSPAGGQPLEEGRTVAIVVAVSGAVAEEVRMPNVMGLSKNSATSKVEAAGLKPYLMYGTANKPEGTVISQWPQSGEYTPQGSEVYIQLQLSP